MITIQKTPKKAINIKGEEIEVYQVKNTDTGEEGGWVSANVFIDDNSWVDHSSIVICTNAATSSINLLNTSIYNSKVVLPGGTIMNTEVSGGSTIEYEDFSVSQRKPLIKNAEIRNGSALKIFIVNRLEKRVEFEGIKMDESEIEVHDGVIIRDLEMNTDSYLKLGCTSRLNGVIMEASSVFRVDLMEVDLWVSGLELKHAASLDLLGYEEMTDDTTNPAILINNLTVEEEGEYELSLEGQTFKYRLVMENDLKTE